MADSPQNPPPATPAEAPKPKAVSEVLNAYREKALKLHAELGPLTKDAPTPGASQKTARRLQATLALFVELCDFLEANLAKGKK